MIMYVIAYNVFAIYVMYALTAAILTQGISKFKWTAFTVFSAGSLFLNYFSDHTIGSFLSQDLGISNWFPLNTDGYDRPSTTQYLAMNLIDLAFASASGFFGSIVGGIMYNAHIDNLTAQNDG